MAKIKTVTLEKEFKFGLPNYSNITSGMTITWEIEEGEEFDFDEGWDMINGQLSIQTDVEPAWMHTKEYKNYFKTTIKTDKRGGTNGA